MDSRKKQGAKAASSPKYTQTIRSEPPVKAADDRPTSVTSFQPSDRLPLWIPCRRGNLYSCHPPFASFAFSASHASRSCGELHGLFVLGQGQFLPLVQDPVAHYSVADGVHNDLFQALRSLCSGTGICLLPYAAKKVPYPIARASPTYYVPFSGWWTEADSRRSCPAKCSLEALTITACFLRLRCLHSFLIICNLLVLLVNSLDFNPACLECESNKVVLICRHRSPSC